MSSDKANRINSGWVQDELGYQKTRSPQIIWKSLEELKKSRTFINLVRKNYRSGNSILVDFDSDRLIIDRPLDLPGNASGGLLVQFRDRANLASRFQVTIRKQTSDSVLTSFPREFFQLQRRQQYRIKLPPGSLVSLSLKGQPLGGFVGQDISAGGILLYHRNIQLFSANDLLKNLTLTAREAADPLIKVGQALVARTFEMEELNRHYAGISFHPTRQEEEGLLRLVRQLELAQIRR